MASASLAVSQPVSKNILTSRTKQTESQVASIRAFLATLTGKVDPLYTAKPELPESGPDTPAPDPS